MKWCVRGITFRNSDFVVFLEPAVLPACGYLRSTSSFAHPIQAQFSQGSAPAGGSIGSEEMPYVHTLIRPMNSRTPSVDPYPSAISGTSRRFPLLPSRDSTRRRRWYQFQETTRNFDPKYKYEVLICCCFRGATFFSSWESSSLLPAGKSFRGQNTTQRGTRMTYYDRSRVFLRDPLGCSEGARPTRFEAHALSHLA